jgi:hypothetical protein
MTISEENKCILKKGDKNMKFEYLTDKKGQLKGVVIPIEIWEKIFPEMPKSLDDFIKTIEDYCLNKAMDEAKKTPLLSKKEALRFLEE